MALTGTSPQRVLAVAVPRLRPPGLAWYLVHAQDPTRHRAVTPRMHVVQVLATLDYQLRVEIPPVEKAPRLVLAHLRQSASD